MIDLRVEIPAREQTRLLRALDGRAVNWAEVQALNRTRNNVQTTGLEAVAGAMGIKVSKLRKRVRKLEVGQLRASGKFGTVAKGRNATRFRLETSVRGFGRPFNVSRWNAKPIRDARGRVVAVTHSAYGREVTAERTWLLGNGAVVTRSGNSFRGVFGPGVAQMMERRDVRKAMEQEAIKRFPQHFKSAIEFAFTPGANRVLRR